MNTLYKNGLLTVQSNIDMSVSVSQHELEHNLTEYTFDMIWDAAQAEHDDATVKMLWAMPCIDVQYMWHPESRARRVLDGDWRLKHQSMLTGSAPIAVAFNGMDENIYTFASNEVRKVTALHLGVHDATNELYCELTMGLAQFNGLKPKTQLVMRADFRRIPFNQAITDACRWWYDVLDITPMPVPDSCRMPLYSSWYNFHQAVDSSSIEEECKLAKELGMEGIILDDGWHSANDGPGYGFTGDWEVCQRKFSDMRAHVAKVRDLDMKYMVWYSVPFVGYYSKCWPRFKDKLLRRIDRNSCGVLDPRYPDVREYIISTYEKAVREYNLDGLKLDFVDQFENRDNIPMNLDMDYACVQEAADRLLTDVMERLRAIKPDIMIEFRQRYIGPAMHRFGNMFRVGDCASDIVSNRVGVTDLRLMCGSQAVHADMLTWNNNETPEHAALQILNVIFGTIQFSNIISSMPEKHIQMTRFWLDFAKINRKVLLESEFIPMEPQFMYPIIRAQDELTSITAVYAMNKIVKLDKSRPIVKLINASHVPELYIRLDEPLQARIKIMDTCGNIVGENMVSWQPGIVTLSVPCTRKSTLHFQEQKIVI